MASSVQPLIPGIRFFEETGHSGVSYTFAIMVSRYHDRWLWVKHKERDSWELPAGHLEPGETPQHAASRELFEETGALDFRLHQIISYEGILNSEKVYGMIFLALISKLGPIPDFEIRERRLFRSVPKNLTYPDIQPVFFDYVLRRQTTL